MDTTIIYEGPPPELIKRFKKYGTLSVLKEFYGSNFKKEKSVKQ